VVFGPKDGETVSNVREISRILQAGRIGALKLLGK
jgi:hypothetical protein